MQRWHGVLRRLFIAPIGMKQIQQKLKAVTACRARSTFLKISPQRFPSGRPPATAPWRSTRAKRQALRRRPPRRPPLRLSSSSTQRVSLFLSFLPISIPALLSCRRIAVLQSGKKHLLPPIKTRPDPRESEQQSINRHPLPPHLHLPAESINARSRGYQSTCLVQYLPIALEPQQLHKLFPSSTPSP